MNSYQKLIRAFQVSCPIVTFETSDPGASIRSIFKEFRQFVGEGERDPVAIIGWDCVRGLYAFDEALGDAAVLGIEVLAGFTDPQYMMNPQEVLARLREITEQRVVVIMQNMHRFMDNVQVMQAIWNLRDVFKAFQKQLILMGHGFVMPIELQNDAIAIVEPLPDAEQLTKVISTLCTDSGVSVASETTSKAGEAALGVTSFCAENLAALSLTKESGLSVDGLWDSKRKKINETPSLQVVTGGTFADIGGCDSVKKFFSRILNGNGKPKAIVFIDEIEKHLGGSGSDSSGVSQDQLGSLLQYMQDERATGCIMVGPPGTSKSAFAKAAGNESGIPTIQLDLGGAKGSLVGESERKIRDALKVITAVSGGATLWVATCNSLSSLPPELRRRFKLGTWFFDLPTMEERKSIWAIYAKKYGVPESDVAKLLKEEWTGAEIESCCEIAWMQNSTVVEASAYIVPVAKQAKESIERLRDGAEGRFLNASAAGVYSKQKKAIATTGRVVE